MFHRYSSENRSLGNLHKMEHFQMGAYQPLILVYKIQMDQYLKPINE